MIRLVIYVLAAISAHRLPEDALAEPILEPEVGELEWELSRKQTFRVAERIATISAGGREYLLNVKRIRRRDYSTVTEIPANELWSVGFKTIFGRECQAWASVLPAIPPMYQPPIQIIEENCDKDEL